MAFTLGAVGLPAAASFALVRVYAADKSVSDDMLAGFDFKSGNRLQTDRVSLIKSILSEIFTPE